MKKLNPDCLQFCGLDETIKITFYYLLGLLPFINPIGNTLQIPVCSDSLKEWTLWKYREAYHNE